jgi:hypothetical protein
LPGADHGDQFFIVGQHVYSLCLVKGRSVTATPATLSISFSLHPFAKICSAVLKQHAIRFATHQEVHCFAIDSANILEIQNNVAPVRLAFKKSPQLGYGLFFDSATQDEYRASPAGRSLNPKSHRSGHLTTSQLRLCRLPSTNEP